jgi:hypothetical protein
LKVRVGGSKIMEILLEVFEAHLVLVDLGILEAVFDLVEGDFAADDFEHHQDVLGHQVALPACTQKYFSRSRW